MSEPSPGADAHPRLAGVTCSHVAPVAEMPLPSPATSRREDALSRIALADASSFAATTAAGRKLLHTPPRDLPRGS